MRIFCAETQPMQAKSASLRGKPANCAGTRGALPRAMAIGGVITSREVIRHTITIVREFGPRAYLRCCAAMFSGRRTTFLACVFAT
ncbi:MAG TPA: hypothetical protein VFP52_17830 [Myxococcales bacterium]|nr:hypothetical protein [Myxococcales bacterium]